MPKNLRANIDDCSVEQLVELLGLARNEVTTATNTGRVLLRGDWLRARLAEVCGEIGLEKNDLISQAADEGASLEVLRHVLDTAKTLSVEAPSESHWVAAAFLYHLTAASAWRLHGQNLAVRPLASYLGLYEDLASRLGQDRLAQVFSAATARIADSPPNQQSD